MKDQVMQYQKLLSWLEEQTNEESKQLLQALRDRDKLIQDLVVSENTCFQNANIFFDIATSALGEDEVLKLQKEKLQQITPKVTYH